MKIIKNQQLQSTTHHKPILYDIVYQANKKPKPLVIFCHGFKGYKDWGSWNIMAEYFAKQNFFFVKFNFSHNGGTVENPIDFPDLESFSQNNFVKELNDLEDIINYFLKETIYTPEIDKKRLYLIGHSRGGGIVTLKACQNTKIKKVISWAGISDIESRFPKGEALKNWKQNKLAYIYNSRTKQQMPLDYQLYQNFIDHKESLTIKSALKKLKAAHLIVHGKLDDVVLPIEASNLHKWSSSSELLMLDGINHALGNNQPWKSSKMPNELEFIVNKTIEFLNK